MTDPNVEFRVQSMEPFGDKSMHLVNSFMKEILKSFKYLFFQPKNIFFFMSGTHSTTWKITASGFYSLGRTAQAFRDQRAPFGRAGCHSLQKLVPGKESLGGEGYLLVLFTLETHGFRTWPLRILLKLAIRLNFIFIENSSQNHMSLTSLNYSFSL